MIKKINYIWKNLLFDFIVLLILSGIVGCNLYGRNGTEHLNFTLTDKLAIGLTCILCLHLIVLLVLTIINFAQRTYFKAIIFFFICIGLYFSIKFISIFLISSTFGGTIDEGNRHNFQKSELCIHFDTIKIKNDIENIKKLIYSEQLDSNLLNSVRQDPSIIPKKITKIECGCRKTDTMIVIFRLWSADHQTYALEMVKKNRHWIYNKIVYEDFDF